MGRERSSSVASKNFKEDFPQKENDNMDIDEHSLRHASYPRKRCPRCTKGTIMIFDIVLQTTQKFSYNFYLQANRLMHALHCMLYILFANNIQ